MRNSGIDVFMLEPSTGATQLKRLTFVKMRIADNFLEYVQKHIKRKVKKEELQPMTEQMEEVQKHFFDLESTRVPHET